MDPSFDEESEPGVGEEYDQDDEAIDSDLASCDSFEIETTSVEDVTWETYMNTAGRQVTSAWNSKRQAARPTFSITLYCAQDFPLVSPTSLFQFLDQRR